MGNIKIIDTGYANTQRTGTSASIADRAGYSVTSNTVYPFTFNVTSMQLDSGANIQVPEELKQVEQLSDATPISFKNPVIGMSCLIDKDQAGASLMKHSFVYQLLRLERTKTVKALYIDALATRDRNNTLVEDIGIANANGVFTPDVEGGTTTPYLLGFVSVGGITYSSDNSMIRCTIQFTLTDGNIIG